MGTPRTWKLTVLGRKTFFLCFKPGFGISRPRYVTGADRFSIWGNHPDRRFWGPRPTRIPNLFGPFLDPRGQTDPSSSSGSRLPARGAGQNSIWSHEAANQDQNHVLGMVRFRCCERCKQPVCFGVGAVLFVSGKMHVLEKSDMPPWHFWSIWGRF